MAKAEQLEKGALRHHLSPAEKKLHKKLQKKKVRATKYEDTPEPTKYNGWRL